MRLRGLVPAMILVSTLTAPMRADRSSVVPTAPAPAVAEHGPTLGKLRVRTSRVRRNVSDLDSRVLASLLAMEAPSDFDFEVRAGDVTCDGHTCTVALAVKLPESLPPMRLSIAVANSRGELSEVKHADCLASTCNVSLVVERGRNTISVGAADGLLQTSAFVLTSVVATPHLEASNRGRSEWF
ncbi:MAG: hypothetical protein QOF63_134 [Thermoanaerobaculia bacterium]|nr:hypothetical protein [Thermoanaerobaculia bacterium]MEA2415412.1 hypothetical protein [Thermoanaerobaculia bacterium]